MFTKRAVGFLFLAVFLYFLGGATFVGWVRIFDAVIWGMLGLSLLLQWLSVTAVMVNRRLVGVEAPGSHASPMEDDMVEVQLDLQNPWFWPRFFLSVSYEATMEEASSQWQRFFVANLSGHGTVRLVSQLTCYRRGLHSLGPVTIESQVPFGLFRRRRPKEAPLSVLVYPRAFPMRGLALVEGAQGPSQHPQSARSGQEIIGSREYHPGDPLRHIHWRNTARLRRLVVKEVEDTAERALTLAFDASRSVGEGRETTLEYSIKLAASLGLHAMSSGESVRLLAGSLQAEWTEPEPFLRALALLEPAESPTLASLLQSVPSASPVIAILASGDEDSAGVLKQSLSLRAAVAAVVLAGFGGPREPAGTTEFLRGAGVPTVVCRKGNLAAAIRGLEDLGARPGIADGDGLGKHTGLPMGQED